MKDLRTHINEVHCRSVDMIGQFSNAIFTDCSSFIHPSNLTTRVTGTVKSRLEETRV